MDKNQSKSCSMSSPPKSTKNSSKTALSAGAYDMVSRTFHLVTSRGVVPYYILSIFYSFHYGRDIDQIPAPRDMDYPIFKVLPIGYLIVLIKIQNVNVCPIHDHVKNYILMGLVASAFGEALLAYSPDYVGYWAGLSFVMYFFYTMGFYQYYQGRNVWAKIVIPFGLIMAILLAYLVDNAQGGVLVCLYAGSLTTLAYFALARFERCRTGAAYLGWAGVKLFVLSDFLFTLNVFVPSIASPFSAGVITMAYFLGQLGIALSTYTLPQGCPPLSTPTSSCQSKVSSASVSPRQKSAKSD